MMSDKDVDDPQKDEGEETENKQQPLSRDNLQKKMMNPPDSFKDMRGLPRDAMSNMDRKQLPVDNSRLSVSLPRSRDALGKYDVRRRMGRGDTEDQMIRK